MNKNSRRPVWAGAFFILAVILTGCAISEKAPPPTLMPLAAIPTKTAAPPPPTNTPPVPSQPAVAVAKLPVAAENSAENAPAAPTPSPSPTPISYVAQRGDALLALAAQYEVDYNCLLQANPQIENPNDIVAGETIIYIPLGGCSASTVVSSYLTYRVQPGDTLFAIASKFGVTVENLQNANPNAQAKALVQGTELVIPWGGIHVVAPGQTPGSIAFRYGVSVDDIVAANEEKYPIKPGFILPGWELVIPRQDSTTAGQPAEAIDCAPQPPRVEVIAHTVQAGEDIGCLTRRFGVTEPTILYANLDILNQGSLATGNVILIPPADGALYTLTEEDAANDVTLEDIASWYSFSGPLKDITDWQGQEVSLPLKEGQQLYVPGADLLAGDFDVIAAKNLNPPAPTPGTIAGDSAPVIPGPNNIPPSSTSVSSDSRGWYYRRWDREYGRAAAGYCPYTAGAGWSNTLTWPVTSRTVHQDRGFRSGHNGIDIITPIGSPVYAAASGTVVWAGYSPFGGGFAVILAHGNEWYTNYFHLSAINVSCGQVVSQGSFIGSSGDSATYFPHVHFEIVQGNTPQNPLQWLPNEVVYVPGP